jgi:hypothetical protein
MKKSFKIFPSPSILIGFLIIVALLIPQYGHAIDTSDLYVSSSFPPNALIQSFLEHWVTQNGGSDVIYVGKTKSTAEVYYTLYITWTRTSDATVMASHIFLRKTDKNYWIHSNSDYANGVNAYNYGSFGILHKSYP